MKIIEDALKAGAKTLSENDSKKLLTEYGIPVTEEKIAKTEDEAVAAASEIGYPVVLKGSGAELSHKTEMNLIVLDVRDEKDVRDAFKNLISNKEANVEEVPVPLHHLLHQDFLNVRFLVQESDLKQGSERY
jgi:acyl-CoA synthetase (NDP forming)